MREWNRLAEARREILRVRGDEAEGPLATITTGDLMVAVRKCARKRTLKDTLLGVEECIVDRVSNPRRGVSTTVAPLAGDLAEYIKAVVNSNRSTRPPEENMGYV